MDNNTERELIGGCGMSFLKEIEKRILVHDGSKGYLLQKMGLKGGECGELWNLTNQDAVREVHRAYLEAGSDVLQTNTFPGNRIHLERFGLGDKTYEINYWGSQAGKGSCRQSSFRECFHRSCRITFRTPWEISHSKMLMKCIMNR